MAVVAVLVGGFKTASLPIFVHGRLVFSVGEVDKKVGANCRSPWGGTTKIGNLLQIGARHFNLALLG